MRVLEVTYTWPAETFIVRHGRAVAARLDLIVASKSPIKPNSATIQRVQDFPAPVVNLPNWDHMRTWEKARFMAEHRLSGDGPGAEFRLRDQIVIRALQELKPDVVHFHFGTLAKLFARCADVLNIPYTLSLRGTDIQVWPLLNPEEMAPFERVLAGAAGVHVVCDVFGTDAQAITEVMPDPTTIRTTVPIPDYTPPEAPTPLDGPPHFITVGRLHWRKAFHDVIRAFAHLPEATLDIVGEGPEREHLTFLIHQLGVQDRVKLVGQLPFEQFTERFAAATAYVQSSVAEGFSNAVAEAMAFGKPVFVTPAGGTEEVIHDGENGIVIPMGDAAGMAAKLRQAADADLMHRLGLAARETAVATFSADAHGAQFAAFYEAAVSR
jgi:glycosyltransferase involved in cell wall biosynthesis